MGFDSTRLFFFVKNNFVLKLRAVKIRCRYRGGEREGRGEREREGVVSFERAVCKYYLFTTCFIDGHRIVIDSVSVVYRCKQQIVCTFYTFVNNNDVAPGEL